MTDPNRVRLTSWKEIATYLRREVRTVIRWEKERGLPVHRIPGGQGRSVFAFTDELDRWSAGELASDAAQSQAVSSRWPARIAAIIAAAGVLTLAGFAAGIPANWTHRDIVHVAFDDGAIRGVDREGKALWAFDLPAGARSLKRRMSQAIDLSGDRHADAVAAAIVTTPENDVGEGVLYAFDERGRPLWQRTVDRRLSYRGGDFEPPWLPDDVYAFTRDGRPLVAWTVHHLTWWPSMLVVHDAAGSRLGTFVNAGWLRTSHASADGRHLIVGGFSNSRNGAAFAVLDARNPDGASPEDAGSPYECRDCPAGVPLHYFVIEWSDIATSLPPDEREAVVTVHPVTGRVELRAVQRRGGELIVELSTAYEVTKRAFSDSFWEWHRRLEQSGTIGHDQGSCPYRDGPIVRVWSPGKGWTVLK